MILAATVVVFVGLLLLSLPIVFCLGAAGVIGLWLGGFPMQQLGSTMIAASQSWVLLAIPSFVFAGSLMERAGMSHSLVELARALVGWLRGGLGMSVIVVSYFFSDICGSKMAEVSALGSALMPPLRRAGYRAEDAASLIASGTAMGMLVPPAIFMIVISAVTNQSAVALFLAGLHPGRGRRALPVRPRADPGAYPRLAEGYRHQLAPPAARLEGRGGADGDSGGDPRRLLSRRIHRHRGRRHRRVVFAARGEVLLSQRVLDAGAAHRLRQRRADRRGHLPARGGDDLPVPDGPVRRAGTAGPAAGTAAIAALAVPDRRGD